MVTNVFLYMWIRLIVFCFSLLFLTIQGNSQFKKQFFVEDSKDFSAVSINLKFNSGTCMLKSTQDAGVFSIYSLHKIEDFEHIYKKDVRENTCYVDLEMEDTHREGLSQSISSSLFGNEPDLMNKYWKIFLSEKKIYDLELEYGLGNANIDLSNLAIKNIKIHTGSADVDVGYFSDSYNKIDMDTFYVKVDLGNVTVRNVAHSQSAYVRADVGFGNLYLDLKDTPTRSTLIKGNVGAGTLYIELPPSNVPVKVTINDSWLCSIRIPKEFKKIDTNTYVNQKYLDSAKNSIEFDLDVAMGSLIFK